MDMAFRDPKFYRKPAVIELGTRVTCGGHGGYDGKVTWVVWAQLCSAPGRDSMGFHIHSHSINYNSHFYLYVWHFLIKKPNLYQVFLPCSTSTENKNGNSPTKYAQFLTSEETEGPPCAAFVWIRKRHHLLKMIYWKLTAWAKQPVGSTAGGLLGLWANKGFPTLGDAGPQWGHVCWKLWWVLGVLPCPHPRLTSSPAWEKRADTNRHTGPPRPVHTQDAGCYPPKPAGRWQPPALPHSPLSSSGTTWGERCAWSRRIPGPRPPGGLFFPH